MCLKWLYKMSSQASSTLASSRHDALFLSVTRYLCAHTFVTFFFLHSTPRFFSFFLFRDPHSLCDLVKAMVTFSFHPGSRLRTRTTEMCRERCVCQKPPGRKSTRRNIDLLLMCDQLLLLQNFTVPTNSRLMQDETHLLIQRLLNPLQS